MGNLFTELPVLPTPLPQSSSRSLSLLSRITVMALRMVFLILSRSTYSLFSTQQQRRSFQNTNENRSLLCRRLPSHSKSPAIACDLLSHLLSSTLLLSPFTAVTQSPFCSSKLHVVLSHCGPYWLLISLTRSSSPKYTWLFS